MAIDLHKLLQFAVENKASDIHLQALAAPMMRIAGQMRAVNTDPLTEQEVQDFIISIIPDSQEGKLEATLVEGLDFSYEIPGASRFRCSAYRHLGKAGIAMRIIHFQIPSIEELHLPKVIHDIALARRGLTLLTGTTGSGKSTSLAAMLRHINENVRSKIITLEDPVEFLHEEQLCSISQREVGIDSESYSIGLKQVFRQNPDVILLGEVRDSNVMSEALAGAETGHMVFTTLHTADARHTITRVLSFYPPHDHAAVRELLSRVLVATISMRLLPKKGGGRIPAVELMVNTALIADIIAEEGRLHELTQLIHDGRSQYGMQTFDQCILQQYRDGLIEYEVAKINSSNPSEFDLAIQGITGGGAEGGE